MMFFKQILLLLLRKESNYFNKTVLLLFKVMRNIRTICTCFKIVAFL